ncbi:MAG: hypothetical protein ACI4UO_00595 [Paludibacteraceae bacterium]
MKKTISFVAALLLCVGAFAGSYTLNFVECSQTDGDSSAIYQKGNSATEYIKNVFGDTTYVASIDTRDNIYPARKGCGAKFGSQSKTGFIGFTLANPTEVDSIIISAAMYSDSEGKDGFKAFIVNQEDTAFFTLSAGNKKFENCVWKPKGEVNTIRINQTTAANQRFYVKSITIYPKKAVETAIEQTTESADSKKVLRNGQVLILREGKAYNLFGQETVIK